MTSAQRIQEHKTCITIHQDRIASGDAWVSIYAHKCAIDEHERALAALGCGSRRAEYRSDAAFAQGARLFAHESQQAA